MDAFAVRRREPRVRLGTRALIFGRAEDGRTLELEGATIDLSPGGVAVTTHVALPVGSVVKYVAIGYPFAARACVRNSSADRVTGRVTLGLEFLDDARNPLIIWRAPNGA
jgi:hypothetical protein